MAITFGARTGVALWSSEDDHPQRADFQTSHQAVEDKMAVDVQGTLAARPVAGIRGRYYWSTDDRGGRLGRDDGVTWTDLGPSPVEGPLAAGFTARIAGHAVAGVADPVLVVRGKAGQTGDLARLTDPTGATTLWRVDSAGKVWANAGAAVTPPNTAATGLTVDSAAGQTGDLVSVRVNGAAVATVTPSGRGIVTGGLDVSGSPSGSDGGEVRFPDSGASRSSLISTLSTGSPVTNFQHRATGNAGSWQWGNGTGGATTRLTLSAAGLLSVTGGILLAGSPSGYSTTGEVQSAGNLALTTSASGGPTFFFDHRGSGNAGSWVWRNGTAAAVTQMTLSAAGLLTANAVLAQNGDLKTVGAGAVARLYLKATDGPADAKVWDFTTSSPAGNLAGRIVNDAESNTATWLAVNRTGMTVTSIVLTATAVKVTGGGSAGVQMSSSGVDTGRITATGTGNVNLELVAGSQPSGQVRLCANGLTPVVAVSGQPGATTLAFFGGTPVGKPTITGSRAGNAAVASLLTNMAALGLVTDSTTA